MEQTLKTGGRELEHQALEAIREKIDNYGDEAFIRSEETADGEIEILTAWFFRFGEHQDTVMAEFLFRDIPGDTNGGRFLSTVLTFATDISLDRVPELSCALSIINFYIETGCFALNKPTDLLVYRNTRTFSGDTSEEMLVKDCIREMEQAYETSVRYCTVVLALVEGSLSLEDFMGLLSTGDE